MCGYIPCIGGNDFYLTIETLENQNDILRKDSLFVYIVINEEISVFLDSFITEARRSKDYPAVKHSIYLSLYHSGNWLLTADLDKQKKFSDSIILYKNPYFEQALILHQNILFLFYFTGSDYDPRIDYRRLAELFEKRNVKQCIYFKEPPLNLYDLSTKGFRIKDGIMGWSLRYDDGEWKVRKFYTEPIYKYESGLRILPIAPRLPAILTEPSKHK